MTFACLLVIDEFVGEIVCVTHDVSLNQSLLTKKVDFCFLGGTGSETDNNMEKGWIDRYRESWRVRDGLIVREIEG